MFDLVDKAVVSQLGCPGGGLLILNYLELFHKSVAFLEVVAAGLVWSSRNAWVRRNQTLPCT